MKRAGQIPQRARASQSLARGAQYEGSLPLEQLPRLSAAVAGPSGALEVELRAERDGQGQAWMRGRIRGDLVLTCQRGLHPFPWRCDLEVALRLVTSEAEEAKLLSACEPYRVQDDVLPLREMVEDEVLLALPMLARCEDPECVKRLG